MNASLGTCLIVLLYTSCSTGQNIKVNIADNIFALYGGDGGIWLVTTDRTPGCPAASCKTAQWRIVSGPNGERMVQFTIVGDGLGWVGMAISSDRFMGNDDAYFCSRSSSYSTDVTVTSAVLSGRAPPHSIRRIEDNRVFLSTIESGTLICSFLRPIRVTKTINGQPVSWDLSQENFHLLFAEGSLSSEELPQYHTFRRSTKGKFNFLSSAGYKNLPVVPDGPPSTTREPISIDVERSSSGGLTWTFPFGCDGGSAACRSLSFQPVLANGVEMVQTTVSGTALGGYVGFVISHIDQLGSGDCYYCIRESIIEDVVRPARVISSVCGSVHAAGADTLPPGQIIEIVETQESLLCTFLRPVTVTKTVNEKPVVYDISSSSYSLIYGEGHLKEDGGIADPQYTAFSPVPLRLINLSFFRQQSVKATGKTTHLTNHNTEETITEVASNETLKSNEENGVQQTQTFISQTLQLQSTAQEKESLLPEATALPPTPDNENHLTEQKKNENDMKEGLQQRTQTFNSQTLQLQSTAQERKSLLQNTSALPPTSNLNENNMKEQKKNEDEIKESLRQRLIGESSPPNQALTTSSGSSANFFFSSQISFSILFALSTIL